MFDKVRDYLSLSFYQFKMVISPLYFLPNFRSFKSYYYIIVNGIPGLKLTEWVATMPTQISIPERKILAKILNASEEIISDKCLACVDSCSLYFLSFIGIGGFASKLRFRSKLSL